MLSFLLPLVALPALTVAASYCPFLGPVFPAPTSLSTSAPLEATLGTLRSSLQDAIAAGTSPQGPVGINDTYSIQVFTIDDEAPLLDFHHRGVDLVGNNTLNGDSIYRIASVTKLVTVYMLLIAGSDRVMSDLVTKHLPELAGKGYYDEMTVGSLAGYVSGVIADGEMPHLILCSMLTSRRSVQCRWHCWWRPKGGLS
jgi:CubicO group peptidase (beta-lactamase class C family)